MSTSASNVQPISTNPSTPGASSICTRPNDLRQSILNWGYPKTPSNKYTDVKGVASKRDRDYLLSCTVFSGPVPPMPELGQLSDIYIDTHARLVHVKTQTGSWQPWDLEQRVSHPLGITCKLFPHVNHGIRWQTSAAFRTHKFNNPDISHMDLSAAITQTLIYHRYLDPTNPEGVGKVGLCKEVRAKRGARKNQKPTSSINPVQRQTPPPPPPGTDNPVQRQTPPPPPPGTDIDTDMPYAPLQHNVDDDVVMVGLSMSADIGSSDDEERAPRPPSKPRPNKRNRISTSSSELTSPPQSPKPSFLSQISSLIPLFKRLLEKPKAWLGLIGIQFPLDAIPIEWANGVWTVLPWQEAVGPNPVRFFRPLP